MLNRQCEMVDAMTVEFVARQGGTNNTRSMKLGEYRDFWPLYDHLVSRLPIAQRQKAQVKGELDITLTWEQIDGLRKMTKSVLDRPLPETATLPVRVQRRAYERIKATVERAATQMRKGAVVSVRLRW